MQIPIFVLVISSLIPCWTNIWLFSLAKADHIISRRKDQDDEKGLSYWVEVSQEVPEITSWEESLLTPFRLVSHALRFVIVDSHVL